MKKLIKSVDHLKKGDRLTISYNKNTAIYTDIVNRVGKSTTLPNSVIVHFASGYTFPVLADKWVMGQVWEFVEASREVPDVVPGTVGDGSFGEEGTEIQRIHPVPSDDSEDPFVWIITQNGGLVKESQVLEFRPERGKITMWEPDSLAKKNTVTLKIEDPFA